MFTVKTLIKFFFQQDVHLSIHGIPSTRNSPVETEFCRHGISSTRNFVDTEFRRHGISSTRNFVDTEFRRHGIPSTRNSPDMEFCLLFYFHIFSMLSLTEFRTQKYAEFRGFLRNFANFNSMSLQYVRI